MKKVVIIFIGGVVCASDMVESLQPSPTLVSSQKSTMASVTQDRLTAIASVDLSPTINLIQTQITKESDPAQLASLNQQLQQALKLQQEQIALQREQFEYQKAQDAEAKAKAEAEESRRRAEERKQLAAERQKALEREAALRNFLNYKRIVEEADSGKLSRAYNPYGSELDRYNMNREIKSRQESRANAVREATALSLKWGFPMFDVSGKKKSV